MYCIAIKTQVYAGMDGGKRYEQKIKDLLAKQPLLHPLPCCLTVVCDKFTNSNGSKSKWQNFHLTCTMYVVCLFVPCFQDFLCFIHLYFIFLSFVWQQMKSKTERVFEEIQWKDWLNNKRLKLEKYAMVVIAMHHYFSLFTLAL